MIFNIGLFIVVLLVYAFTHISNKNKKFNDKLFLIIIFTLFFILVATRDLYTGNDTISYVKLFKNCNIFGWDILNLNTYHEKGYLVFNVLIGKISMNYRFFMFVMSFIFNFAIYKFIKKNSKNYLLSVFLYIGFLYFYSTMTMMRQFFSMSIILLSFNFVKERKFLKYALMVVLASFFHSTAWVALLIYPLYTIRHTKKMILTVLISSVVVSLFLNQLYPFITSLLGKESYYTSMIGDAKFGNFMYMLVFIVIYLFSRFVIQKEEKEKNNFYLNLFLVSLSLYLVSISMAVFARIVLYFAVFVIISLPNIIHDYVKSNRVIVNILVTFILLVYSCGIIYFKPEWNTAFNYRSCLFPKQGNICELSY